MSIVKRPDLNNRPPAKKSGHIRMASSDLITYSVQEFYHYPSDATAMSMAIAIGKAFSQGTGLSGTEITEAIKDVFEVEA